jgi:ribonucleoside-diphosphate reductase alpha chain
MENPEHMFYRVAKGIAEYETNFNATDEKIDELTRGYFEIMANFEFTPAGRTLANVGAPTPLVANCIVLHIEDTMESIFGTLTDAALLQKVFL